MGLQEREHGEDAPVVLAGLGKSQLGEDAVDVLLDGPLRHPQQSADACVGPAFRHQLEHLALARRQDVERVVRPARGDQLLNERRVDDGSPRDDPLDELTPREREVLELMASGRSNAGIADSLVISVGAVEKYVSSIFGKLGLRSTGTESRRVLAVLLFLSG